MTPGIARIRCKAEENPKQVYTSLYHHVYNQDLLRQCYDSIDGRRAVGIDGVTKAAYGKDLATNLPNLSRRLGNMSYYHKPSRRSYIDKAGSTKKRPLGISCFEDKIVEKAVKEVLEVIYEQKFRRSSYGYRPDLSCHDALRALGRCIQKGKISYLVEADIKGFFNHVHHKILLKLLNYRIKDKRILRLIRKMLKSGIMEDGLVTASEEGTPQGSILSPLLSNIYLHYCLDGWFDQKFKAMCRGEAHFFRFADDFVACFQYKSDAVLYLAELVKRLATFHLEIEPSKTKLLAFGRFATENARKQGRKPETFDFLGFTHYCGKTRDGYFKVKRRTSRKKFTYKLKEFNVWLKKNRSFLKKRELLRTAKRKWQGHLNYYAITDNFERCNAFGYQMERLLFKWLNRQSQRRSYTWEQFHDVLRWIGWTPVKVKVDLCPCR
ncbi:MAG: group II intron reverse transcriptase/maturase [bacterium]|nr:group II intron reverse transcriptase/maturase [bacterium]